MILLAGDFPWWAAIVAGLVFGFWTIAGIVGAGIAAAGATAAGVNSAVHGQWPWDDPEAWILDQLKGATGGIGTVVKSAMGEPTIQSQLAGEAGGTSRGGGTGGNLQAATGQGPATAFDYAKGGKPPLSGLQATADRFANENPSGPSRRDILNENWKNTGTQIGIQAAASAIPYVGGAISEGLSAASPAISGALSAAQEGLRAIPAAIGPTATGILQQGIMGAGMGALSAGLRGQNPGIGALSGGASGAVSAGLGGLGQSMAPQPVSFGGGQNQGMYSGMGGPSPQFHYGQFQQQPTFDNAPMASMIGGAAKPLAGFAGSAISQAFTPKPQQPMQPMYPRRPFWGM